MTRIDSAGQSINLLMASFCSFHFLFYCHFFNVIFTDILQYKLILSDQESSYNRAYHIHLSFYKIKLCFRLFYERSKRWSVKTKALGWQDDNKITATKDTQKTWAFYNSKQKGFGKKSTRQQQHQQRWNDHQSSNLVNLMLYHVHVQWK